jgi:hypothetical protein
MSIKIVSAVAHKIVRTTKIRVVFEFSFTNLAVKNKIQILDMSINSVACQLKKCCHYYHGILFCHCAMRCHSLGNAAASSPTFALRQVVGLSVELLGVFICFKKKL